MTSEVRDATLERVLSEGSAAGPPVDLLQRVSLEQYAGVTTALAESHPLDAVLANEQIAPEAWAREERAWKVRIAKDGAHGPLLARFDDKRIIAEDCLTRVVSPIDTDLAAWMSFLRAYGAHPAPFEMLTLAGLGINDLSRLQRRWSRRMAADAGLPKEAADLSKKAPLPLPPIRVEPAVLQLFPWSRGPALRPAEVKPQVAAPADTSFAPGKLRLYSYVAIQARLAESGGDEKRVLAKLGITDFDTTDAGWQTILSGDPELHRDYRLLLDAQRAKLRAGKQADKVPDRAAPSTPAPLLPRVVPAPAHLAGTALALDVPRTPALPFVEGKAPAPIPMRAPASPILHAPPHTPRSGLGGTALWQDAPLRAAVPFLALPPPKEAPPPLTLEQHASLSWEIAEAPERALETLKRYRITSDQKRAADQHYAERLAREPGAREAWDRAYQTYRALWIAGRISR